MQNTMINNLKEDTIAAIATPGGSGGIAIIRVSGSTAVEVADKAFRGKEKLRSCKSHTINYGHIVRGDEIIDEVLVSIMLAPKSYTCEDVVEINCHGGVVTTRRVLEEIIRNGARLAESGEFTKRAFLNGRVDLTQAEAVIDVINAETELSQKAAQLQLAGGLRKRIDVIRDRVLNMLAGIEAAIDYPEYELENESYKELKEGIVFAKNEVRRLLETADSGRIIKEGIRCVILGSPNVGKSSFMNLLSGFERAIVTSIAGTTRDTIEEFIDLDGVPLKLIDTAGIRSTNDEVEQIGVNRAMSEAEGADLILLMLDGSRALTNEDADLVELALTKRHIILVNKTDLKQCLDISGVKAQTGNVFEMSVKEGVGVSGVRECIKEMFGLGELATGTQEICINARHKQMLMVAEGAIDEALEAVGSGMAEDFVGIHLRSVITALGWVSGHEVDAEVVDRVFTRFCLGK